MEYDRKTESQFNYTLNSATNIKFKTELSGSDVLFHVRYASGFQSISADCEISLFVFIDYKRLTTNGSDIIQQSGRRLHFYEARFAKI